MRAAIHEMINGEEPRSLKSKIYDRFMIICIIASLVPLFFKETYPLFVWIERITVCIFIVDYILRWITADMHGKDTGPAAFAKYPFTFFALMDLLSILPSLMAINSGFKIIRVLRLNKTLKVLRILRYSKSFERIITTIKQEKQALGAVCFMAIGYVIISSLIMFNAEPESFDTFFEAFYWAMVTLTTVGYGDIYPVSVIGRIISMISSFVGIAIIALPTGIISAGYMEAIHKEKENK